MNLFANDQAGLNNKNLLRLTLLSPCFDSLTMQCLVLAFFDQKEKKSVISISENDHCVNTPRFLLPFWVTH